MGKKLSTLWKRTPIEHHANLKRLHFEDATIVIENSVKAIEPEREKPVGKNKTKQTTTKNYPDVLYDFTEFIDRANQGNCERDCEYDKNKVDGEEFQDMDLGETGELTDTTPEELTDDLMEMSALIPVPDDEEVIEEAAPENKWTLDSLAEGF